MLRKGQVLGALLLLQGCGGAGSPADGPFVIGAVLPLSGPDSPAGRDVLSGMRLAAAADPAVTIRAVDGEGKPAPSARRFRELASEPTVRVIAGGWFAATARTLGAVATMEEIGFLALSPLASPGGEAAFPVLHRLDSLGSAAARFGREDLDRLRAGVFELSGSEASERLAAAFRRAFVHLGGDVRWTIGPDEKGRVTLPPGPEQGVDLLFVAGPAHWAEKCMQGSGQGSETVVMLAEGWGQAALPDLLQLGSPVYVATFYADEDPAEPMRTFLDVCADSGITPSLGVALGWDTVTLVREAGRKGGGSREGVRRFLLGGTPVVGATGRVGPSVVTGTGEAPAICMAGLDGLQFVRRIEAVPVVAESEA